jgi:hypothetical protein
MSNKNLKLLFIVLIALVGLLGWKLYTPKVSPQASPYQEKTKNVDVQSVQSIEISSNSEKLELKKEDGIWMVNDKKVDVSKVNNLFSTLIPENAPDLIAQTDKRHQEFELTDDLATRIKFGDKLIIFTGKYSSPGIYARFDGDPTVYLLKNAPPISTSASSWYDKIILSFDQTKATKITFRKGSVITILTKQGDQWSKGAENGEIEKDKVDTMLSQASSLTAQSLFDATEEGGVYPKEANLVFTFEYDDKSETLEFSEGDSDYLVKRRSDDEQFIVSEGSIASLISFPSDILK